MMMSTPAAAWAAPPGPRGRAAGVAAPAPGARLDPARGRPTARRRRRPGATPGLLFSSPPCAACALTAAAVIVWRRPHMAHRMGGKGPSMGALCRSLRLLAVGRKTPGSTTNLLKGSQLAVASSLRPAARQVEQARGHC